MIWKELLAVLPGTAAEAAAAAVERVSAKLDELLAGVEEVAVGQEEDLARQALIRLEWRATSFSPATLDTLVRGVPQEFQSEGQVLRDRLAEALGLIATKTRSGARDVVALRPELLALHTDLATFVWRLGKEARRARRTRTLALLVPSVLAAVSAAYLRSDRGLRLVRIEGAAPPAAYLALESNDGTLAPSPDYLGDYMREFSKFYFGHPSQFESMYFTQEPPLPRQQVRRPEGKASHRSDPKADSRADSRADAKADSETEPAPEPGAVGDAPADKADKPSRRRVMQHKLSLRNASHGEVSYISSVEAVLEATEPAPFPWHLLTVTPHVTVQAEDPARYRTLMVRSDGIGPAVELTGTLTAKSGLEAVRFAVPLLHRDQRAFFAGSTPGIGAQPLQGGMLSPPLYLRLPRSSAGDAAHTFEVKESSGGDNSECEPRAADYGTYEEIRTTARLSQLTQVAYQEPWTLELRYASLKGPAETLKLAGAFDGTEVFYRTLPNLLAYDPRCPRGSERDVASGLAELVSGSLGELATVFADDRALAQPRGIDLLTARLGLDLANLPVGSRVAAADPLDGFLNPQGVLAVYLNLNQPAGMRYLVTLRVNGQPAARYRFAGLVPEFFSFDGEGRSRAVSRLRQLFASAAAPARK